MPNKPLRELQMLPTFLIAGAGKAGTTSLYRYAAEHPQVDVSAIKEPWFFTQEVGRNPGKGHTPQALTSNWNRGIEWYESLYSHAAAHNARGEASPYMARPDAPALIYKVIPQVKLVFILRHPVERVISHYWQDRKMARRLPSLDQGITHNHHLVQNQIVESGYKEQLERFFRFFSREQVLILLFEDLPVRPYDLLGAMFHHIGVDPSFTPAEMLPYNSRAAPRLPSLHRAAKPVSSALKTSSLPGGVKTVLLNAGRFVASANLTTPKGASMSSDTRAQLVQHYERDTSYVESLIGRELWQWRR